MRFDIRFAALSPELERRVRLAARTLVAHQVEASPSPWEGAGCALVVANADDAYGKHVIDVAQRRGVRCITVGGDASDIASGGAAVPADVSISNLARALLQSLQSGPQPAANGAAATPAAASKDAPAQEREAGRTAMTQLAAATDRDDIEVRHGARSVYLLRSRGRVLARTLSDLLEVRDRICEEGPALRRLAPQPKTPDGAEVATSLDSFLLVAALRGADLLPAYPERASSLEDWPDLAAAGDAADALRVSRLLLRRAQTPKEVARAAGLLPAYVSACFWAFDAAGLLRTGAAGAAADRGPGRKTAGGLWARLAAHFGMSSR